jgi:hypothetical protein
MNNTQKIHLSPLLAQKKLLDGGNSNNGNSSLAACGFNSSIKDTPSFHTPNGSNERSDKDYGLPLSEIASMLARKAKSVYERYLASEDGVELLKKAAEYEIPYDIKTLDIVELRDKVEEFEEAIEKAASVGIDWKEFGYDLIGIEQEVASFEQAENDYLHIANSGYWSDRVVGA